MSMESIREACKWGIVTWEQFQTQRGKAPSSVTDEHIFEGMMTEKLQEYLAVNNWQQMRSALSSLAYHYAYDDNIEMYRQTRAREYRCQLMEMREKGIKEVRIIGGACGPCNKLDDRVFTIENALEKMPLPVLHCQTCLSDVARSKPEKEKTAPGFCRCVYSPVID